MYEIIKIYNKQINFITINEQGTTIKKRQIDLDYISYQDIKANFPKDFNPVAIYFSFPEYYFIPIGLEKAEAITFALVSDWNLNFLHLKDTIKIFDYILTDLKGVKTFKEHGFNNVSYFPLFGLQVENYDNFLTNEKLYDISFIGNLNDSIQVERAKYLYKVSKLSYKYNIFINSNIYNNDYKKILCKSKIIFNLSIRSELNIRTYEAMNAKSLLFLEDSNLEANKFLKDGFHYISYNKENLERKIDFYLSNDVERNIITDNAYNYVKKYNINYFERELYSLIFKQEFKRKNLRKYKNISDNSRIIIDALNTIETKRVIEVLNYSFENIKTAKVANLELCRQYIINQDIDRLIEELTLKSEYYKNYIPLKINLIKILFISKNLNGLNKIIDKLILDLESKQYSLYNLSGFFIDEVFTRFKTEYEKYISEKNIKKLQECILWNLYKIKADICINNDLKIKYLLKADKIFDSIDTKIKLGDLFYETDINKSYNYYLDSLKINPFNIELIYKIDKVSDLLNINYVDREYLDIINSSEVFIDLYNEIKDFSIKKIRHNIELIKIYSNDKKIIEHLLKNLPDNIPQNKSLEKNVNLNSSLKPIFKEFGGSNGLEIQNILNTDKYLIEELGEIYFSQNNFKKAIEFYAKLLTLSSRKDLNILNKIKICLEKLGDYKTIKSLNL